MTKLRALVGLIFVGVLIYTGLWHTSAFQAEKDTAALLAHWRDKGLRVDHGKIKLSGFPYRFVITIDGLHVRTRGPGLDFGTESLTLISHLWTPGHWLAEARNVGLKAADEALSLTDGTMRASYRLHENGKTVIVIDSLTTDDFSLQAAPGLTNATSLKGWQLFLRTDTDAQPNNDGLYEERFLDFKLTVDTGTAQFETEGGIMGPVVRDWTEGELAAWRDAGGLLALDRFDLTVPGGRARGDASLTLDEAFRPLGSASLAVAGGKAVADALSPLGLGDATTSLRTMTEQAEAMSLMLQMGSLTLDGATIPLKPVL